MQEEPEYDPDGLDPHELDDELEQPDDIWDAIASLAEGDPEEEVDPRT